MEPIFLAKYGHPVWRTLFANYAALYGIAALQHWLRLRSTRSKAWLHQERKRRCVIGTGARL